MFSGLSHTSLSARLPPIWLLIGISALGPFTLNGAVPANSQIVADLNTTYASVHLMLTVFLVATMVSQIVLGNWADRYGRRPVMIGSLLVFGVGGVICALAPTIELLLVGRFIQGIGSAVCIFLPRTIVRDIFSRDKSASVIGFLTTAMMVAPLFAPALGGWVTDVSTWRWLYAALAIAGFVFAFLAYQNLNETLEHASTRPVGSRFFETSITLLRIPRMQAYLAIQAGTAGVFYSFIGGAPYILMELRDLSASAYGQWFIIVALGYMSGNYVAGHYSHDKGVDKMIGLGLIPGLSGLILFWAFSTWGHPLALFLPMIFVAFGNGMCLPNVMSACMSVKPELSGSASGLAGAVQIGFAIIMTVVLSFTLHETPWPLYFVFTFSGLVVAIGYWSLRKMDRV